MLIADILRAAGIEVKEHGEHHHVSEGWVGTDCPLCSPGSRHFRLGFSDRKSCSCWVCGKQWAARMMSMLSGLTVGDCAERLGHNSAPVKKLRETGAYMPPSGLGPLGPPHRRYLEGRGFDPGKLVETWDLKGTGQISSHPWTIFIPVVARGREVSWTTRELHDRGIRYKSASPDRELLPLKTLLYGEDYCSQSAIVHEGPADVWRTGPGAVATFGLVLTDAQVFRLSRFMRRVICFDSDAKAQRRARKLAEDLAAFDGETVVVTLDAKDAGSASDREIKELRKML